MCDILRRLASPALTKQQYLSSLNEFSRLCRAKRKEELFQIIDQPSSPAAAASSANSSRPVDAKPTAGSTLHQFHGQENADGTSKQERRETPVFDTTDGAPNPLLDRVPSLDHPLTLKTKSSASNVTQSCCLVFKLNRVDENDIFTMDDVFRW